MAWVIALCDEPPAVGTIMARDGHAGAWEPFFPGFEGAELFGGVVDKITPTSVLILVDGEYPRESVGPHLEEALAAGLLKDIAFTEAAIE